MRAASRAVRLMGLKLLLLSSSLAAIAAVGPAAAQDVAQANFAGMKLVHLILGTMGAGVSLFFLPQFSSLVLGRTIFSGVLAALVGTPFAVPILAGLYTKIVGEPPPLVALENLVAVALGVGGVYLIPGLQAAWKKRGITGVVDLVRGKQPPSSGGQS